MVTCPNRRTLSDILNSLQGRMEAELCAGQTLPNNDPISILTKVVGGAIFELAGDIRREEENLFAATACCDRVTKMAAEVGITPTPASKAEGEITITGTVGATIPADIEFIAPSNAEYRLATTGNPTAIDATGSATLNVVALVPGIDGNVTTGTIQTAQSYTGIDAVANVSAGGIVGGAETEDCESLRARLVEFRSQSSAAGTEQWFIDQVLSFPGVTRACVAPEGCGPCGSCDTGFLTIYPFAEGFTNEIPSLALATQIQEFIWGTTIGAGEGVAPIGSIGEIAIPSAVDVTLVINDDATQQGECTTTAEPSELEALTAAADTWLKENVCVGGTLCYSQLTAAIQSAVPSFCICNLRIEATGITNNPDAANPDTATLPCGQFPLLTAVTIGP